MSGNVREDLVNQVAEITDCSTDLAKQLLSACANNVEAAVALFFEQGGNVEEGASSEMPSGSGSGNGNGVVTGAAAASSGPEAVVAVDDDGVRAPIAPFREQLIDSENDNFYPGRPVRTYWGLAGIKVCPLRDFAREASLMEEQLNAAASSSNGALSNGQRRAETMVAAATSSGSRQSRLVDLFRPPTDLIYAGTFQIARSHATGISMWLLVNVQSDNFDSHVLNRDVWSDKKLRILIRRNFVFWQVDQDSGEGRRFTAFYKCENFPYVCVIDPRTGEEVLKIISPKRLNVLPTLQKFLNENKDFAVEERPSTSKRSMPILIDDDDEDDDIVAISDNTSSKVKGVRPPKRAKLMELSEEDQIAMAIRNSMKENGSTDKTEASSNGNGSTRRVSGENRAAGILGNIVIDDDESMASDDSMDSNSASGSGSAAISASASASGSNSGLNNDLSYEELLGKSTEFSMIKLRLLNADDEEQITQLKWPSDTICKALRVYVCQMFPHIPKKDKSFKIICAFPRTSLTEETNNTTLKDLGLFPSAYLHVTLD